MGEGWYFGLQVTGMIEWGQKSEPKKIPRASKKNPKKSLDQKLTPKKSHAEFQSVYNLKSRSSKTSLVLLFSRITMRPGYVGTYHKSSDRFEYLPKNPYLTLATQRKILATVSHPKQSQNRKFQTPKILRSFPSLEFGVPFPPLSTPLGLSLALSQSIGATRQWPIGTRRPWGRGSAPMTSWIFRLVQTNKQETTELLLTAHKLLREIMQFRVHTVLLSDPRDGLSLEVSRKQVKEVVYVISPHLLTRTTCL